MHRNYLVGMFKNLISNELHIKIFSFEYLIWQRLHSTPHLSNKFKTVLFKKNYLKSITGIEVDEGETDGAF